MKFCLVTTFFPPQHFGGDAVVVAALANLLAEAGHAVTVVHSADAFDLLKGPVEPSPVPLHPGIRIHPLRSPWGALAPLGTHLTGHPLLQSGALREILDQRFDVVHWHNLSLVGGPAALKLGDCVQLCTLHDYWWFCPTSILFKYRREACRKPDCIRCTLVHGRPPQLWRYGTLLAEAAAAIDRFLAPSEFVRRRYAESPLRIQATVLPHFAPDAPGPEIGARQDYYFFAGRLERAKGLETVLPLFARTRRRLLIAGSGSRAEDLQRMARGAPGIEFLGRVEHARLAPLYARARATLVPSICFETFGLTILESLQQKTPVVVSDFGALKELVAHTGGGLVYGDLPELEAHLDLLDRNPETAAQLGATGQARLGDYSPQRHLALYLEIIEQERGKRAERVHRREGALASGV